MELGLPDFYFGRESPGLRYPTVALRPGICVVLTCQILFAQSALERAVALTRAGQFADARQIIAGSPEPAALPQKIAFHRLRAAIASGLHDATSAAEEMREALAFAPKDRGLLTATAVAEQQANHPEQAAALASRAGEWAPAKMVLASIAGSGGRFDEAVLYFRRAIALDPSQESFQVALSRELIEHQAFDAALQQLSLAIQKFPRSGMLKALLGVTLYATSESNAAEKVLLEAIELEPESEAAKRCLEKIALESSAAPDAEVVAALCHWERTACSAVKLRVAREANDRDAMASALAVLQSAPAGPVRACSLGLGYQWTGAMQNARKSLEECVAMDPSPQNHYRLGVLYRRLGNDTLAAREMELRQLQLSQMSEETAFGLQALHSLK